MNVASAAIKKMKSGTCPHGLPLGACPICNGGGGGGAKKAETKTTGEMSWDECYAVWKQILKTKEMAQFKKDQAAIQAQLQAQIKFAAQMEAMASRISAIVDKVSTFADKIQTNPILKPIAIAVKLAIPVLNLIKDIPLILNKVVNFIQTKVADITDKLNAVFGELKNALEKKLSDKFNNFKKKIKSIFSIYEPEDIIDEEKKIEEDKRKFELKNVLNSIKERLTEF